MTEDTTRRVQQFWTGSPETYGEGSHGANVYEGKEVAFGTKEFFDNVDRNFIGSLPFLHTDRAFGTLFPFEKHRASDVLEIGCGMGTMAMQWAKTGCRFNAVDLSPMSIKMTSTRFGLFGHKGNFILGDGRQLPFADASFDYAYSWGVLHHSPDLKRSLHEMMRVIRPGGEFGLMLYYRPSFLYQYFIRLRQGFLNMESQFLGPLELASRYTDDFHNEGNPHTWPVTKPEVTEMLGAFVRDLSFRVHGPDVQTHIAQLLPVIGPRLPLWAIKPWARRFGWSLWFSGVRA